MTHRALPLVALLLAACAGGDTDATFDDTGFDFDPGPAPPDGTWTTEGHSAFNDVCNVYRGGEPPTALTTSGGTEGAFNYTLDPVSGWDWFIERDCQIASSGALSCDGRDHVLEVATGGTVAETYTYTVTATGTLTGTGNLTLQQELSIDCDGADCQYSLLPDDDQPFPCVITWSGSYQRAE